MTPKPHKKETWSFDVDGKVFIEVCHWGVECGDFEPMHNGHGVWNYYCILPERILKERFKEVWLEDQFTQFTEASPVRITHDYMLAPFSDVNWHCGITYYDKIGQVEGHRMVKLGCDYSHLYDEEHRGYDYSIAEVCQDAINTAQELIKLYSL